MFEGNVVPEVNETLWTLGLEVACYGLIAVAGLMGVLTKARWLLLVGTALASILGWDAAIGSILPFSAMIRFTLLALFLVGAAMKVYGVTPRLWLAIALSAVAIVGMFVHLPASILLVPACRNPAPSAREDHGP